MERKPIGDTGMHLIEFSPEEIAGLNNSGKIARDLMLKAIETGSENDLGLASAANKMLALAVELKLSPVAANEIIEKIQEISQR